jgi:membrane protease YdiL (CAAX protease family)
VHRLWSRLPIVVRAVVVGLLLAAAGSGPWAGLAWLNMRYGSAVPWAVVPTALYLWLYWRYVRGEGWPRSTSASRRASSRANRLDDAVWAAALFAGMVGLVAVLLIQIVTSRLVTLPQQQGLDVTKYPLPTLAIWVLMGSVVAGVVEEVSFRGYLQQPIERRHGALVAILVTGVLFGLLHFTHREMTLMLMPYYLAAAAVYGMLAHLTDSILPSMVLHAGGNMLVAFDLFARGRSEWQASPTPQPLIWQTGADAGFWVSVLGAAVAIAAAVAAYGALARVARVRPAVATPSS